MRSLLTACFLLSTCVPAFAQKGYTAGLDFEGTGPYAVPARSYGGGWSWVSRVNPQVPVYIYSGQARLGMFAVRDAVQQKALRQNLEKWCDEHQMQIANVRNQGSSFRIDVRPRDKQPPTSAGATPQPSKFAAAQSGPPARQPVNDHRAQLADIDRRIELVKKQIEANPDLPSLIDVLRSLEKQRAALAGAGKVQAASAAKTP